MEMKTPSGAGTTQGFERFFQENISIFPFLDPVACFEYEILRVLLCLFGKLLSKFSRSWSGSKDMKMVSGSVKVHEEWRVSKMRRS